MRTLISVMILVAVTLVSASCNSVETAKIGGSPSDDWTFTNCLKTSGPGVPEERGCEQFDLDNDLDVDLRDFAEAQLDPSRWE